MLFDTHLHIIDKEQLTYPWLKDQPALDRNNTFADYANIAAKIGISGCLHMEVDVAEAEIPQEISYVAGLTDTAPSLLRGMIASCRPESEVFPHEIDAALVTDFVRGFRRVLHVVPDEVSQSSTFRDNIKRLSNTGLTYDICMLPRQRKFATALIDHCPDVTFILDHCGVPDIAAGDFETWRAGIRDVAQRPNVHAKISGIIAYAKPDTWTLDDLRPYVEETATAFGHKRLIWGSDSPVCNLGGSLEAWVAATHALTAGWSTDEKDALYRLNAYKLWNL